MRTGKCLTAVAALVATVTSVPAQNPQRIPAAAFLDAVVGKTASFYNARSGQLVGIEEYLSRDLSVWKAGDNVCVYGQITIEEGRLCFLYDDDEDGLPVCWWTFLSGDQLLVMHSDLSEIQEVGAITDEPVGCPATPIG